MEDRTKSLRGLPPLETLTKLKSTEVILTLIATGTGTGSADCAEY